MIVYRRTNTKNGKVYIGKTVRSAEARWLSLLAEVNRGGTNPIHNAVRKYGSETFKTDILYEAPTVEALNAMETFFIILHQSHKPENGYNLTLGGDGAPPGELNPMWGKTHTEQAKSAIREARLGMKQSPESNEKRRLAVSGEKNPAFGKVYMNDEAVEGRRKGGLSHVGKARSLVTKQRISKSLEGKTRSELHCLHISQAKQGKQGHVPSLAGIERIREAKRQWWAAKREANGL